MPFTLSLNINPLVNRLTEPGDLIDKFARDLRVRDLQLTHEFSHPSWLAPAISRLTRDMSAALEYTGVRITSGETGPFGRPDYVDWFKTFADQIGDLGGEFAIFTDREMIPQIADPAASLASHVDSGAAALKV